MAYKDPERRRIYHREYGRSRRERGCQTQSQTPRQSPLTAEYNVRTAQQALLLLEEQINEVRACATATALEKARTIGFLVGVTLRAVEAANLAARVEAIELSLAARRSDKKWTSQAERTAASGPTNGF